VKYPLVLDGVDEPPDIFGATLAQRCPTFAQFGANLPTVFLSQLGALHFGLGGVVGRRQSSPSSPIFRIMAIHST
jgi:hypothetical protein